MKRLCAVLLMGGLGFGGTALFIGLPGLFLLAVVALIAVIGVAMYGFGVDPGIECNDNCELSDTERQS